MDVIPTSRLQKSVDLYGIFCSFSWVLHEWLKIGHKSFTMGQLFPMVFLSVDSPLEGSCAFTPRTQQGLWPVNYKASAG